MGRSLLTVALVALATVAAGADTAGPDVAPDSKSPVDEAPSLLRKFHVHYNMPQTFVDVPQDSAGAGLRGYGGVARTILMVFILMFSISHFSSPQLQASTDQHGEMDDGDAFADDYDDFADDLESYEAEEVALEQAPEPAVAEAAVFEVVEATPVVVAEPAQEAVVVEAESAAVEGELDQASCILLAQNDLFADEAAAARLAERCWRMEKRARVQQRATALLARRRSKRYADIESGLDTSTFEVFEDTGNVANQARSFAIVAKPVDEASPAKQRPLLGRDGSLSHRGSPSKPLSARALPFELSASPARVPLSSLSTNLANRPLLQRSGKPTAALLQSYDASRPLLSGPGAGVAVAGMAAVVALAVLPMTSGGRKAHAKKHHTAFPTNQHKKIGTARTKEALFSSGDAPVQHCRNAQAVMRHMIRSS